MKKILTVLVVILLLSFTSSKSHNDFQVSESINTLEDMKEWMMYDIEIGDVDAMKGDMYIENIERTITRLKTLGL